LAKAQFINLKQVPGQARGVVVLQGADVLRFLQGVLSNDVSSLPPGQAVAAALLTVKAQLVSEAIVVPGVPGLAEGVGLIVPEDRFEEVFAMLDRHIIMDDVRLERRPDLGCALVWPAGTAWGAPSSPVLRFSTVHPAPGDLLVGPEAALDAIGAEVGTADPEAFLRHRVQSAAPGWGHELTAGRLPPEMGYVHAVSYDKGCFMGQEPLARVQARGQVNRVMVRVRAPKQPAERVRLSAPERERAGEWTTWAPADAGVVGLALVHRSVANPGTVLTTPEGWQVEVTSGPLGDDPESSPGSHLG
jgi:hypothetical protein